MPQADPSLSIAQRIDLACDQFEAEWKAGKHPKIEDIVAAAPQSDQVELRQVLLAIELELQGRSEADTSVTQSSVRNPVDVSLAATALHPATSSDALKKIGRFELRGVLGSGAFGKVYRAFDSKLNREVAIKVPMDSAVKTEAERAQFLKEARAIATINHPNVCQVFAVGEFGDRPYIVMALVPGVSLADALKSRKSPLPQKQVALIVRKIAAALATAHEKGIVHRDLKPANIMFDRDRKDIVVMDFGLARGPQLADARSTQSGVIMGTPAYMSPEQARGDAKGVGPAGDVFSLGVILYEMLTGSRPFVGTATEVIGQILHVEPERPSQRRAGIDTRMESICLKAMAKDAAARYSTMKEFAAAIDSVLRENTASSSQGEAGAKGDKTRSAKDRKSADEANLAEVFAALSEERKKSQAETAAVVEAAIRKTHPPRRVFIALGLLGIFGIAALTGLIFYTRSGPVTVTIELSDIDLTDQSLSFFLDDQPISAEALANPIELKPGEHILVVKRGDTVVKRMRLNVTGGRNPGIKVKDITLPHENVGEAMLNPVSNSREAAGWVLGLKGFVTIEENGKQRRVERVADLPPDPLRIVEVWLVDIRDEALNDGLGNLQYLKDLMVVSLFNSCANDRGIQQLAGMTQVKYLNLHGCPFTDAAMPAIGTLTGLEELWTLYQPLTDDGIAHLESLTNLQKLLVSRAKLTNRGLKSLGKLTKLKHLNIGGTLVDDGGLRELQSLVDLELLDLMGTQVEGRGLRALAPLPRLRTLLLGDGIFVGPGKLKDEVIESILELPTLETLSIFDGHSKALSGTKMVELSRASHLQGLDLEVPALTDDGLRAVCRLKELQNLRITSNQITDNGVEALEALDQVWWLRISGNQVTDASLNTVGKLWQLKVLDLNGCSITGSGLTHLSNLGQLTDLNLHQNPLRDDGLEAVTKIGQLTRLHISETRVTDRGLEYLQRASQLRFVDLTNTAVTATGKQALKAALPQCQVE